MLSSAALGFPGQRKKPWDRWQGSKEAVCPLWSPGSDCSTVPTETDIEHRCSASLRDYRPSLEKPLLSGLSAESRRLHISYLSLVLGALLIGALLGSLGTVIGQSTLLGSAQPSRFFR